MKDGTYPRKVATMTTVSEGMETGQGLPALSAAPIGDAKSSGLPAFGRPPVPGSPQPVTGGSADDSDKPRQLRIGDKVRSLVDDVCVTKGLTGLVVNVAPPRYGAPARARILWHNDTVSMADATTFEVITPEDKASANTASTG